MQTKRTRVDWGLFAVLTLIWGAAYPMTRVAVQKSNPELGLPVEVVLSGRLTLGAIILVTLVLATGHKFPSLKNKDQWASMVAMGVVGMTLPFFCITTAQKTVDSSLAALYLSLIHI